MPSILRGLLSYTAKDNHPGYYYIPRLMNANLTTTALVDLAPEHKGVAQIPGAAENRISAYFCGPPYLRDIAVRQLLDAGGGLKVYP
jgi:hypothetical protein